MRSQVLAYLEHYVDECGQEVISTGRCLFGGIERLEDVLATVHDAHEFVLRRTLAVHLNHI